MKAKMMAILRTMEVRSFIVETMTTELKKDREFKRIKQEKDR